MFLSQCDYKLSIYLASRKRLFVEGGDCICFSKPIIDQHSELNRRVKVFFLNIKQCNVMERAQCNSTQIHISRQMVENDVLLQLIAKEIRGWETKG